MADDWYRRKTWTPKDREEFLARLRRSRSAFNKAQYARIQAYELLSCRTQKGYLAALELLDMILAEWCDSPELAPAHHHRAECFLGLGDLPQALESYRLVFKAQREQKKRLTTAHLDFGWLAITTPLPELYDEAMSVLCEFHYEMFPSDRYQAGAIQALILDSRGKRTQAQAHASIALEAAAAKHSGLRYHPNIGLVKATDQRVHRKLLALAG